MFCAACDLPGAFDAAALSDVAAIAATHMPIFGMTPHMPIFGMTLMHRFLELL